jgi:hypothetical protein
MEDSKSTIRLLAKRFRDLQRTQGTNGSFKYFKEVWRLTVRAIAKVPTKSDPCGVRVKVDSFGIPTVIPLEFRRFLRDPMKDIRMTRGILSLIQIFRV